MSITVEIPASLSSTTFHGVNSVGALTYFNGKSDVFNTDIGRYCSIAQDVLIGPGEHPLDTLSTHPFAFGGGRNRFKNYRNYEDLLQVSKSSIIHQRTTIGADVWIGARSFISQGITIGHGCVIGAGSIVTRDLPPYAIAVGTPATVIRHRFSQLTIERLLRINWWDYWLDKQTVGKIHFTEIDETLDRLEFLIGNKELKRAEFKIRRFPNQPLQRKLYKLFPWG